MKFITIKESNNSADLFVLKSKLESEGIYCRIDGELSNQILNYILMISARLQVLEKDMEEVQKILIETGEWEEEKATLTCPICSSTDIKVKFSIKNILNIIQAFLIAIFSLNTTPSMYQKSELICKSCGTHFKK